MLELGVVFTDTGAIAVTDLFRSYKGTKQPKTLCVNTADGLPTFKDFVLEAKEEVKSLRRIWIKYPNPFKKNPLVLVVIPSDQSVYVYKNSKVILKKASSITRADRLLFCVTLELPPVPIKVYKALTLSKTVEYAKISVKENHNYTVNGVLVHERTDKT